MKASKGIKARSPKGKKTGGTGPRGKATPGLGKSKSKGLPVKKKVNLLKKKKLSASTKF